LDLKANVVERPKSGIFENEVLYIDHVNRRKTVRTVVARDGGAAAGK
jgi:hypothetical protein